MKEIHIPSGVLPEGVTVTSRLSLNTNEIILEAKYVYVCYGVSRVNGEDARNKTDLLMNEAIKVAAAAVEFAKQNIGK